MKKISIPLILALFAATACWPFSSSDQKEMSVKRISSEGRVQIVRGDETIDVTDATTVEAGDVLSTSNGALAKVRLLNSDYVHLAENTEVRIESPKAVEGPLHTGALLADVDGSMRVDFGGVAASTSGGIFRIDKGLASVRAGAYSGDVKLETPGQPRVTLSKLFEVQAAASDLRAREPYRLDNGDAWDRVYLKEIVELDADLTPLAQGLKTQLGGSRPTLLYFHALAKQGVGFMKPYLSRSTIDLLTAFVIANHAPGPMGADFKRAFRLKSAGAEWPVAAGILDASFKPLVAQLTNIAAATGAVAGGTGNAAVFSVASAQAVNDAGPGDSVVVPPSNDTKDDDKSTDDDDDDGGGVDPEPSASPEDCSDTVQCGFNDVRNRIGPSPSPSSLGDTLDGVPK